MQFVGGEFSQVGGNSNPAVLAAASQIASGEARAFPQQSVSASQMNQASISQIGGSQQAVDAGLQLIGVGGQHANAPQRDAYLDAILAKGPSTAQRSESIELGNLSSQVARLSQQSQGKGGRSI